MRTDMTSLKVAVAICVVASVASAVSAFAQDQGRGRSGYDRGDTQSLLLLQESVQKELGLSADQKDAAQKLQQKLQEEMMQFFTDLQGLSPEERAKKMEERATEIKKKLAEKLLPPQIERLDQINLQYRLQYNAAAR